MTYGHTELDLEDSITGNVSFIGSDRATVAGQRVIVKYVTCDVVSSLISLRIRSTNRLKERDRELSYWWRVKYVLRRSDSCLAECLSRHPNLPQLVGCSSRCSPFQFILFRDKMSAQPSGEMCSLAAFMLEMIQTEHVFTIVGKIRDFVSNFRLCWDEEMMWATHR